VESWKILCGASVIGSYAKYELTSVHGNIYEGKAKLAALNSKINSEKW